MTNQELRDVYIHTTERMLSLGKLRIADIYPIIRLIRPHFYNIALKTSCLISKERFLEDMKLLKSDITNYEKLWSSFTYSDYVPPDNKKELKDIFKRYLKRNSFNCDSDIE